MKDTDTAVQLNKIQDEITQDLLQRIREAKEEQKSLKREHNEIISEKEIKLKELCSEQGSFKREEGKVNLLEEERTKLTSLRSKMESDNLVNEKKLDENLLKLRDYYAERQGLRDEFNALLHKQIGYEARRVQIAGDLSCEKEAKNKLESDIKAIIENKKVQDLYLDSLTIRMEHLNQTMMEYSSQCGAMVSHSKEIESLIRNAEQDISQITTDKRKIMQAWNLAIINIGKRDETIAGFNEALDEKHILIKSTIASTEKAKSEVISIQNRHEYLTAVQMRHIKRKDCFESCLYSVKSRIKESHLELANVTKVKERTLASYYNTSKELQEIERNNENILNEIQNLENARRLLMDEIFEIINVESKSKKVHGILNQL
ncbi:uncharacterized protein [Lepeophtheirus salmonis]|uniref:uncharacterized protein n=1 Tax=Lepeophtheirus salmonis TaxID=72036 RepID=UPI001AE3ED4C|nr:putative WEB family protein At1g65010, chloroplastic [Lepeophtheirus salmonis]